MSPSDVVVGHRSAADNRTSDLLSATTRGRIASLDIMDRATGASGQAIGASYHVRTRCRYYLRRGMFDKPKAPIGSKLGAAAKLLT